PYVNVVEQGTSNGVITDNQGNYSIRVSATDAVLVFSSIGFNTQTISVDDERVINISMEASISGLDEVVVIGYGTSSKRDITGAVSAISEDEFNGGAITNPLQQISGKAPGVIINQQGNEPGSTPSIRIRGINSLIGGN